MQHPRRNEVYRDVGLGASRRGRSEQFIDVLHVPFEPDAALLLCSDGLTDCVAVGGDPGDRRRTTPATPTRSSAR